MPKNMALKPQPEFCSSSEKVNENSNLGKRTFDQYG
jgi:hypothetical protein